MLLVPSQGEVILLGWMWMQTHIWAPQGAAPGFPSPSHLGPQPGLPWDPTQYVAWQTTFTVPKSSSLMWPPPNSFFTVARVAAYSIFSRT